MGQNKVKKQKVVDLGSKIVLDSERCILCSRCVRFTEEVSKTNELGIFNRGDHSEIGTYSGKPLENDYAVNTVDICPVGALTSKDFRFRQRVWFLKDKPSVCTGCSTGCSVDVFFNKEGMWRVKPRYNKDVNGYWMCDEGREIYKSTNVTTTEFVGERGSKKSIKKENRLTQAIYREAGNKSYKNSVEAVSALREDMSQYSKAALVLTGQYSSEEYDALLDVWKSKFGGDNVYHWMNNEDKMNDFDGLLIRGDKNPNTKGLQQALEKHGITAKKDVASISGMDFVLVAGPENQWVFDDIPSVTHALSACGRVVWMSACHVEAAEQAGGSFTFLPVKTFAEKSGTFVNHAGVEQKFEKVELFVEQALSLSEISKILKGDFVNLAETNKVESVANEFVHERGQL